MRIQNKNAFATEDKERRALQLKYNITAWFYDILDYPWERQYRHWRPQLVGDTHGDVLEVGVGTGRNLKYYRSGVNLTAIDLCHAMVEKAKKRGRSAVCTLDCRQEDATKMTSICSRLLEMVYSKIPKYRRRQIFIAPLVEKIYGARFDRNALKSLKQSSKLRITRTYFLKRDIYQVIEGHLVE